MIAKGLRFAAKAGLDLVLLKQPSWSALRDRLAAGYINFALMLSAMPLSMGLGSARDHRRLFQDRSLSRGFGIKWR